MSFTTLLAGIGAFSLGLVLAVGVLAALYAYIDLAPTGVNPWPVALRRLLFACGASALCVAYLGPYRDAFLWGAATYAAVYVLQVLLLRVLARRKPVPTTTVV